MSELGRETNPRGRAELQSQREAQAAVAEERALDSLTERELAVLTLMARGRSNAEIAAQLFLSETTVKSHVTHVFSKLRLRDRTQAVVVAYESGLVEPGEAADH